jgi:UDP-N-acetylglucosamine 2-epimerase
MRIVLEAAARLHRQALVVHPHLDPGGSSMLGTLDAYRELSRFHLVSNLAHRDFLAVARESAVWIGNSSAGVIESASLGVPVVNLGTRQQGRERGMNVVDAAIDIGEIVAKVEFVLSDVEFRAQVAERKSPWGNGRTGETVANLLGETDLPSLIHKSFDFPLS